MPVPIRHIGDLSRLAEPRFPCIVKPLRGTANYRKARFARGYKVCFALAGRGPLPPSCRVVVQEWIEGPDSELYFCLQYRAADGATVCSFTGRKLSIWPPDVGVTASCTAAPDARPILQPLTEALLRAGVVCRDGRYRVQKGWPHRPFRDDRTDCWAYRFAGGSRNPSRCGTSRSLPDLHEIGLPGLRVRQDPPDYLARSLFALPFNGSTRQSLAARDAQYQSLRRLLASR